MLTNRAMWLLMCAGAVLVGSVLARFEPGALAGLGLLIWFGMEWLRFRWRVFAARQPIAMCERIWDDEEGQHARSQSDLQVVRHVRDVSTVTVRMRPDAALCGLRVWVEDVVPPGMEAGAEAARPVLLTDPDARAEALAAMKPPGSPRFVTDVRSETTYEWSYQLHTTRLGKAWMPGLEFRITDSMGLFEAHRFHSHSHQLTILPFLIRPQTTVSVVKPQNAQLVAGQHRFLRPGGSGELLSIRDYQAGDPPKSIAWKVSARLGRLMTCEYEREAPIRSTIITDLSFYQFVGRPGPAPADNVAGMAASVARLLLADRDPVASLIVNGNDTSWLPHGQGERQLTRLLHVLLSFVGQQVAPPGIVFEDLLEVAWTACRQRFPELYDSRVNAQQGFIRLTGGGRRLRQRQQLAFALEQIYQAPLGHAYRLMEDRQAFSAACRRFLSDFPSDLIPVKAPPSHQLAVSRNRTTQSICRALARGVARAVDNELFVIVVAHPVMASEIEKWEAAVRLARAKHHRVMLLFSDPHPAGLEIRDPDARRILVDERRLQIGKTNLMLSECMTKLGATMCGFSDPRLAERVAAQVELLRSGRGRATGAR